MNMWRLRNEAYIYLVLPTGTVNTAECLFEKRMQKLNFREGFYETFK